MEAGWRRLGDREIVRDGDQYFSDSREWVTIVDPTKEYRPIDLGLVYRRRVEVPATGK